MKIKDWQIEKTLEEFLPFDGMFKVNKDMIEDILSNELKSINKGQFFVASVLSRIEDYNNRYLYDLDNLLDKILDSTDDLDLNELKSVVEYSSRLCSDIYNNFILNISRLEE